MKKFLVVLVAVLFATGAFAQDAEKKGAEFKYSVFGVAYGVMGSQGDASYDYEHIRVRPMFTATNGNVSAVVRLEMDYDFGSPQSPSGTDQQNIEVKWAYLQVKDLLIPNLTFTTGLKDYFFPMVVDNDFAMTTAAYDFGMGSATLGYVKLVENDTVEVDAADVDTGNDVQVYVADVTVKAGAINVRPAVFYFAFSEDSTVFTNYALNVTGDFGMVGFEATAAYLTGKDGAFELDSADMGYDVIVNIKPAEGITIGLFTTSVTGNDGTGDQLGYNVIMDGNAGAPDGRLFLLEANGVQSNGGDEMFDLTDNALGYTVYGLTAEAAFGKIGVLAQYGYVLTSEDNAAGDSAVGQEFDLEVGYEVAPATKLFVQASYMMAGDDTFYADDATQYAWGLITKI